MTDYCLRRIILFIEIFQGRDSNKTIPTLLVRLRHEVLPGAHPGPELVLRPNAPAVVAHPLHPVLSETQVTVRRQAGRLTTVHGI